MCESADMTGKGRSPTPERVGEVAVMWPSYPAVPPIARPEAVTIDDLAEPRFTDEVKAIRAMMAEAAASLALEPRELMAAAAQETGLSDFGPSDFVERLDVLCHAMRTEAALDPVGVTGQHALLTGLLRNRLLL